MIFTRTHISPELEINLGKSSLAIVMSETAGNNPTVIDCQIREVGFVNSTPFFIF